MIKGEIYKLPHRLMAHTLYVNPAGRMFWLDVYHGQDQSYVGHRETLLAAVPEDTAKVDPSEVSPRTLAYIKQHLEGLA